MKISNFFYNVPLWIAKKFNSMDDKYWYIVIDYELNEKAVVNITTT